MMIQHKQLQFENVIDERNSKERKRREPVYISIGGNGGKKGKWAKKVAVDWGQSANGQ